MALQVSHTAHDLHPVSKNAAVSGATAPKPPTNICALIARIIVAHIVKEAKRSPSQHRSDSGRRLTGEMKQVLTDLRFTPIIRRPTHRA
jgi:hypothetical protein